MKTLILFFLITALSVTFAQEKGKMSFDERGKKNMYVGIGDKSVFKDTSFATWYNAEYDMYEVDIETLKGIKPESLKDLKITMVVGTWCGDTKREIPRFFKILETLNFDEKNLEMIFVDREKKNPLGDISALGAKNIPTIIFYKSGKELGRIIEAPVESLEKDFLKLLN